MKKIELTLAQAILIHQAIQAEEQARAKREDIVTLIMDAHGVSDEELKGSTMEVKMNTIILR